MELWRLSKLPKSFTAGRLIHAGIMAYYVIDELGRRAPFVVKEVEWKREELEAWKYRMYFYGQGADGQGNGEYGTGNSKA